jgi:hypothetical protein
MKHNTNAPSLRGFGNPHEIPSFIARKGYKIDKVELRYGVKSNIYGESEVSYQYWFFENGNPIAVHGINIGGYDKKWWPVKEGITLHEKDLQNITNKIIPGLDILTGPKKHDFTPPWRD